MKILLVAGARPNFMKIAPLYRAFTTVADFVPKIVHTGQHSDFKMSGVFFRQLGLPQPDYFLDVKKGTSTAQVAGMMLAFEKTVRKAGADLIVVVGDVNSSLACALVAAKMQIPLVHVEAGLRCGNRQMQEEINRLLIDSIADLHFVSEEAGVENLLQENIPSDRIHLVGNVMIDSLVHAMPEIEKVNLLKQQGIDRDYLLLTMHRPQNVDAIGGVRKILELTQALSEKYRVIFPVHPRTLSNINQFNLLQAFTDIKNLDLLQPAGYFEFIHLVKNAKLVITDSGGVQEETTFLRIPCITLRNETERPVTVLEGTNRLIPDYSAQKVLSAVRQILTGPKLKSCIPAGWDGNAAVRIAAILREKYINS